MNAWSSCRAEELWSIGQPLTSLARRQNRSEHFDSLETIAASN